MEHKKETKIVVAIENPSTLKAFKAQLKDKSSDIKFNVLISYPFIGGVASGFVYECRDMIKTLYLDSGAYSVHTGKIQITLSEYSKYINMFGDKFDHIITLDDDFDDPEHNQLNQKYLEENLPQGCKWKPIPAIHDEDALSEISSYYDEGHPYIGINCKRDDLDKVLEKVDEKYPDLKIHLFGNLKLKDLKRHKPYSADSAGWANMGKNYLVNYWDGKTVNVVDFSGKVGSKKSSSGTHYIAFSKKHPDFKKFLRATFNYDLNKLIGDADARFVVNLYYNWQLEQELNKK
jgi:hypothetical protein